MTLRVKGLVSTFSSFTSAERSWMVLPTTTSKLITEKVQNNNTQHSKTLPLHFIYRYAECRYAGCRGPIFDTWRAMKSMY